MYSIPTWVVQESVRHRLNDLRVGMPVRYTDDEIRQSVIKAIRWVDPLGELITFDMTWEEYGLSPQTDRTMLEILQVETRVTGGPQVIVPPSLWNFQRGQQQMIRLTYPPTSETIVITGMLQTDTADMEDPDETTTEIRIDPTVIELYATSYLYEREAQWNAPGSVSSETSRAFEYRQQADARKLQMLEEIRSVYRAIPIPEGDQPQMAPQRRPATRRRA